MFTIPYFIDPWIWVPLLAVGVFVLWVYRSPPNRWIKQLCWAMILPQLELTRRRRGTTEAVDLRKSAKGGRIIFWFCEIAIVSLAVPSLLVCVGVIHTPPKPEPRAITQAELDKIDIVADGQKLFARPKGATTQPGETIIHYSIKDGTLKP